ncbi:hypothetical protein [Agreia sp. COWG]|uniref:hypothetical protein n=1 Tax=Agreia sp. COWG TaxID=2773266 RepID=UPI001927A76B|nr:hypothetical protein [Agreia sp. COWG]CAD5992523.1 conserved protein of unknown function [Agreia sp. COWG]
MTSTEYGSYTAKLTDGPLEGRTVRTAFSESGEPLARLEIPAGTSKHYLYTRGSGVEFNGEGDRAALPSAVDYRFIEARLV